jgi:hypothetical protein
MALKIYTKNIVACRQTAGMVEEIRVDQPPHDSGYELEQRLAISKQRVV